MIRDWLNRAHSGRAWKIFSFLHKWDHKVAMTVKTDDLTSGSRDLDPQERLGAA